MKNLINNIVNQLKDIENGTLWIGTNYNEKLNLISEKDVFIRPFPNLHSISEIISHLTVWRNETILKIKTGKGSITDDCEDNWLTNDILVKKGWNKIISEYKDSLYELIEILRTKDDSFLNEKYFDTDFKDYFEYQFVVYGMLHHDIYHLGQLGIIIKLLKEETSTNKC